MVLDTMRKGRSLGRGATCDYMRASSVSYLFGPDTRMDALGSQCTYAWRGTHIVYLLRFHNCHEREREREREAWLCKHSWLRDESV